MAIDSDGSTALLVVYSLALKSVSDMGVVVLGIGAKIASASLSGLDFCVGVPFLGFLTILLVWGDFTVSGLLAGSVLDGVDGVSGSRGRVVPTFGGGESFGLI